jgi:hypothetical protein
MSAVRYTSIRCDNCLDGDPAIQFHTAKEARAYFQKSLGT